MIIKQALFLYAFILYASCNFSIFATSRPMLDVIDQDVQDSLGLKNNNNNPSDLGDLFFTPDFKRNNPSTSSSFSRIPDFRNDFGIGDPQHKPTFIPFESPPTKTSNGKVPIVYNGEGQKTYNGHSNNWWYEIDANGNVDASPNFLNDQGVPPEVKQQVQSMSNQLKHRGH